MRTPRYKKTFFAWLRNRTFSVDRHVYKRSRQTGEVEAHYIGKPSENRPVIFFLHGFGSDAFYPYVHMFRRWLDAGFNIFTFDLDGHGRNSSSTLDSETIAECMADAFSEFIKRYQAPHIFVVGHSFGGAIVIQNLNYLLTYGVKATAIISTPTHAKVIWPLVGRELTLSAMDARVRQWFDQYDWWDFVPPFGPFKRGEMPVRLKKKAPGFKMYAFVDQMLSDLTSVSGPCPVPTLLIYGSEDRVASKECYEGLLRRLPGTQGAVVQNATHLTLPFYTEVSDLVSEYFLQQVNALKS